MIPPSSTAESNASYFEGGTPFSTSTTHLNSLMASTDNSALSSFSSSGKSDSSGGPKYGLSEVELVDLSVVFTTPATLTQPNPLNPANQPPPLLFVEMRTFPVASSPVDPALGVVKTDQILAKASGSALSAQWQGKWLVPLPEMPPYKLYFDIKAANGHVLATTTMDMEFAGTGPVVCRVYFRAGFLTATFRSPKGSAPLIGLPRPRLAGWSEGSISTQRASKNQDGGKTSCLPIGQLFRSVWGKWKAGKTAKKKEAPLQMLNIGASM